MGTLKIWKYLDNIEDDYIVESIEVNPLYKKLKDLGFKFSSSFSKGASYIMPDGKFLNIEENRDVLDLEPGDISCHPQLDVFVLEKGLIPKNSLINRVLCETDNAIRLNDGTNLSNEVIIGLPKNKPTEDQYKSLINWLYNLMTIRTSISVGDERSSNVFKEYNFKEYFPEDIVKKIKNYYNNGILRELKEILVLEKES